jgi:predicted Rossmann fold nucleotide-binding protein DprA/Smf involved in DNA uptake
MSATTREQLHQQIDSLPDHIVEQIANLIISITTQQKIAVSEYTDWQNIQWQEFSLTQFFREDDEIQYSLEDAEEIYKP